MADKSKSSLSITLLLISTFLFGCSNTQTEKICLVGEEEYEMNIDFDYRVALKKCKYNDKNDLRTEASLILEKRKNFLSFGFLKKILASTSITELVLVEKYSMNTNLYEFVLVSKDNKGNVRVFCEPKRNTKKTCLEIEFNELKKFIYDSNILLVLPNLENYFVDDGTYYFYTIYLDRTVSQTLCYAPISSEVPLFSEFLKDAFKNTNQFYLLAEYLYDFMVSD